MPASLVDDARETVEHLIRFATPSHSSNTAVTDWVQRRLNQSGFTCERLDRPDRHGVLKSNLVAVREPVHGAGDGAGLAYFAHTDVVPADRWEGPGGAFDPTVSDGRLYGRGACDMKGSLATMLAAVQRVSHEDQTEPIWIVCTSDEETGFQGAKTVRRESQLYRQMVARQPVGIIGEPTRLAVVHAHKGITGFTLTSRGRAAHSSTREGRNANLAMVPLLVEIAEIYRETEEQRELWDERFDPPTLAWTFGVSDGCEAINVTPALSRAWVSLRPMPSIDGAALIERVREKASSLGVDFQPYDGGGVLWVADDHPWVRRMCQMCGCDAPTTVSYCTDAGEFTELEALVVCGPGSIAQAHTADEYIELDQLAAGVDLYERVLRDVCTGMAAPQ